MKIGVKISDLAYNPIRDQKELFVPEVWRVGKNPPRKKLTLKTSVGSPTLKLGINLFSKFK